MTAYTEMTPEELALDGGIYADLEHRTHTTSSSWPRESLTGYVGLPPELPEIAGLFYPGRRHLVSGPGEAHKTWLVLAAAVMEVNAGRGVVWCDLDGMGPREIASRLVALGVAEDALETLVYFTQPEGELGEQEIASLLAWAEENECRLLIADAFTGYLQLHGLDGNAGIDVEAAWRQLDAFTQKGIAVVLLDHVVKNADNRNGQAIGSERKGTAAHLHFDLKPLEKLQRGGTGRSRVDVTRDRGAYFTRPHAGEFVLVSDKDSGAVTWRFQTADMDATSHTFRPTNLMEKVSRHVEAYPEGISKARVEDDVAGKAKYVRAAIEILAAEGFLHAAEGGRGKATVLTSVKAYREAWDETLTTSSLPRPEPGRGTPGVTQNNLVPSSPPNRDEVEVGTRTSSRDEGRGSQVSPLFGDDQ